MNGLILKNGSAHGGDVYGCAVTHDFSINVNPLGLPEGVRQALRGQVDGWSRYPDPECRELVGALAARHGIGAEQILCGSGAAELIYLLAQAVRPRTALVTAPAFSEYRRAAESVGCEVRCFPLSAADGFDVDMEELAACVTPETDLVFFCNPNNPNGRAVRAAEVEKLATACGRAGSMLVLDECFCELLAHPEEYTLIRRLETYQHVVILRAFTKSYAMAGLRVGYLVCGDPALPEKLRALRQPWSVSLPAQQAACAALREQEYLERARALITRERRRLSEGLEALGFRVYPSDANFVLFHDGGERRADELWRACLERGLLIRSCRNYEGLGAGDYRVCVATEEDNALLLRQLAEIIKDRTRGGNVPVGAAAGRTGKEDAG